MCRLWSGCCSVGEGDNRSLSAEDKTVKVIGSEGRNRLEEIDTIDY
jgi:hypothetical protein